MLFLGRGEKKKKLKMEEREMAERWGKREGGKERQIDFAFKLRTGYKTTKTNKSF